MVVDLRICVTDAAISLRHASKTKQMWTKKTLCFSAAELEKRRYVVYPGTWYEIFFLRVLLIDGEQ